MLKTNGEESIKIRLGNVFWTAIGSLVVLGIGAAISAIWVARQEGVITRVLLDERLKALGDVFQQFVDSQTKVDFGQDDRIKTLETRQSDIGERLRSIEDYHHKNYSK